MGSQLIAKCKCGVETTTSIGGGMYNFETLSFFPYLCEHCHAVVQVNRLAKRKQCPKRNNTKVIPYDDPRLSEQPGKLKAKKGNAKEQFGKKVELTDGNYRCPQCGKMTLRFFVGPLMLD
jgi:Zn finger protein HypA/HybF involved in hydrogenase expression